MPTTMIHTGVTTCRKRKHGTFLLFFYNFVFLYDWSVQITELVTDVQAFGKTNNFQPKKYVRPGVVEMISWWSHEKSVVNFSLKQKGVIQDITRIFLVILWVVWTQDKGFACVAAGKTTAGFYFDFEMNGQFFILFS